MTTLEVEAETLIASADKRFAAISKLVRVRVEASKKRLMTVLPRSVGTFLISSLIYVAESFGGVEDEIDFLRREVGDSKKVFTF